MPNTRDRRCSMDSTMVWQTAETPALTALQREIVRGIVSGQTNAEIAAGLGMTPGTVGTHVGRIVDGGALVCRAAIAPWAAALGRGPPACGKRPAPSSVAVSCS